MRKQYEITFKRCRELELEADAWIKTRNAMMSDYEAKFTELKSQFDAKMVTEFQELSKTIENLSVELKATKAENAHLMIRIEMQEEGLTVDNEKFNDVHKQYSAKIKQLVKEVEDYKIKFKHYCTKLETRLKREFAEERKEFEARIRHLMIELENEKEKAKYGFRVEESLQIKKLKLKKTSIKAQLKFLSERLYLSDYENRKLLIEIGRYEEERDRYNQRHENIIFTKREIEQNWEETKVKLSKLEIDISNF